jgi:hypothetical protein
MMMMMISTQFLTPFTIRKCCVVCVGNTRSNEDTFGGELQGSGAARERCRRCSSSHWSHSVSKWALQLGSPSSPCARNTVLGLPFVDFYHHFIDRYIKLLLLLLLLLLLHNNLSDIQFDGKRRPFLLLLFLTKLAKVERWTIRKE